MIDLIPNSSIYFLLLKKLVILWGFGDYGYFALYEDSEAAI